MFSLFAKLIPAVPAAKADALARQVVEASLSAATELVAEQTSEMTLSEARGYVRARCGRIVRRQTRLAINRHPDANSTWTNTVVRIATERLVPLVLRESKVGVPRSTQLPAAA